MLALDFQNTNLYEKKNPPLHHVTISNPSSYFPRLLKENYQIDRYFFPYRKRNYKNSHFHQQPLRLLKISSKTDYRAQNTRTRQANFVSQRITAVPCGVHFMFTVNFRPSSPLLFLTHHVISTRFACIIFKLERKRYLYTGFWRSHHAHKTKILIYPQFIDRLKSAESAPRQKCFAPGAVIFHGRGTRPWKFNFALFRKRPIERLGSVQSNTARLIVVCRPLVFFSFPPLPPLLPFFLPSAYFYPRLREFSPRCFSSPFVLSFSLSLSLFFFF